jgi:hypothetical protein
MNKQLALLALAAASVSASAATVDITYHGKSTSSPVVRTSQTGQVAAGVLNYVDTVAGSFLAYCIEPAQANAPTSTGAQVYQVGSFTGSQATLLQGLYSSTFSSVDTVNEQAAFQLAVWEIMRETTGTLNVALNAGSFYLAPRNGQADSLQMATTLTGLANSYISAAQSYQGPAAYTLTKLSSVAWQDLVVANPVPEPGTYAMLLAGLGAIGMIARRRLPR